MNGKAEDASAELPPVLRLALHRAGYVTELRIRRRDGAPATPDDAAAVEQVIQRALTDGLGS